MRLGSLGSLGSPVFKLGGAERGRAGQGAGDGTATARHGTVGFTAKDIERGTVNLLAASPLLTETDAKRKART